MLRNRVANVALSLVLLLSVLMPLVSTPDNADAAGVSFTMVVLPDTQYYSESYPATFYAQTNWIVAQESALNIQFVMHLGDLVEHHDIPAHQGEWDVADTAMGTLDTADIPYGIAPGNHDLDALDTAGYDATFPSARFAGDAWYGAGTPAGQNWCSYQTFTAYGHDYMVLDLISNPTLVAGVLDWVHNVLVTHKGYEVFVNVHGFINDSGALDDAGDVSAVFWWAELRKHGNIAMIHCGHVPGGEYNDTWYGDCGNSIQVILTDYQDRDNGGNGWLRYYTVYPITGLVEAYTYSPTLDSFETDSESQFSFYLSPRSGGWWDTDWLYRTQVSFNAATLTEDLINFPIMLNLTDARVDFAKIKADGADIRFIDSNGSTALPYEITTWDDTGETGTVWVTIPQIDQLSDYTDYFYVYYGNSAATDSQAPEQVWEDTGAVGAWHLYTDDNNGATVYDSTENDYDLTVTGATWSTSGYVFDGNDYLKRTVANWRSSDSAGSVVVWFTTSDTGAYKSLLTSCDEAGTGDQVSAQIMDGNQWSINQKTGGAGSDTVRGDTDVTTGIWRQAIATSSGTAYKLYVDGSAESLTVAGGANTGDWFADTANRDNLVVGAMIRSSIIQYFVGTIGEAFVYSDEVSAEEARVGHLVTQEFYTGVDGAFLDWGDEETWVETTTTSDRDVSFQLLINVGTTAMALVIVVFAVKSMGINAGSLSIICVGLFAVYLVRVILLGVW